MEKKEKIILKLCYECCYAIIVDDFPNGADISYPLYKSKKDAIKANKKIFGKIKKIRINIEF